MTPITTFRSPVISLWQSALNSVLAQRQANQPRVLGQPEPEPKPGLRSDEPIVLQTAAAAAALLSGAPAPEPEVLGIDAGACAKLYLQLILAEARSDAQLATKLRGEISFSTCDPLWADTLAQYEKFRLSRGAIPYRPYQSIDDFVIQMPSNSTAEVRIGLIADWGTGTADARRLLTDMASQKIDVLIHLGDIYYSCTPDEARDNFLTVCKETLGPNIPIFTLAGNHDMYSGGNGYYALLDDLGQPASYFCLRNEHWQLLAMDTGFHDTDPFSVTSNLTYLEGQEVNWHLDKIAHSGGRRTILLSHHQLFSSANSVGANSDGKPLAVNPNLYAAFANVLDSVALWVWGHEHNLIVFEPYVNLKRGRCIGSAAIPKMVSEHPYALDPNLTLPQGQSSPPQVNTQAELGNDGSYYYHAYALIALNDATADVYYYQLRDSGSGEVLYHERLA